MKRLLFRTIENWLSSPNVDIQVIAIKACNHAHVSTETFEKIFTTENRYYNAHLVKECIGDRKFPISVLREWINSDNSNLKLAAMIASKNVKEVPFDIIEKGIEEHKLPIFTSALKACEGRNVPYKKLEEYLDRFQYYAVDACIGSGIPIDVLRKWMTKEDYFRMAAMMSCIERDVPTDLIIQGLEDPDHNVITMAAIACKGKNIPLEILRKYIDDETLYVDHELINSLQGTDVPMEYVLEWLNRDRVETRIAALNFCRGKSIPRSYIESYLEDSDVKLRTATMQFCNDEHIEVPLIRTFEPPERVYKKCMFNVVLIANIPKTAQVRGGYDSKSRASEAEIIGVIGETYGKKLGVSTYDYITMYEKEDHVKIENFDYSNAECSTGFHFFNTLEEALDY